MALGGLSVALQDCGRDPRVFHRRPAENWGPTWRSCHRGLAGLVGGCRPEVLSRSHVPREADGSHRSGRLRRAAAPPGGLACLIGGAGSTLWPRRPGEGTARPAKSLVPELGRGPRHELTPPPPRRGSAVTECGPRAWALPPAGRPIATVTTAVTPGTRRPPAPSACASRCPRCCRTEITLLSVSLETSSGDRTRVSPALADRRDGTDRHPQLVPYTAPQGALPSLRDSDCLGAAADRSHDPAKGFPTRTAPRSQPQKGSRRPGRCGVRVTPEEACP